MTHFEIKEALGKIHLALKLNNDAEALRLMRDLICEELGVIL